MASTVSGKGIDHYKWHRLLSEKASTVKNGIACLRKGKLRRRHVVPLAWRPVKQQKHLSLSFAIETKNYNSRVVRH